VHNRNFILKSFYPLLLGCIVILTVNNALAQNVPERFALELGKNTNPVFKNFTVKTFEQNTFDSKLQQHIENIVLSGISPSNIILQSNAFSNDDFVDGNHLWHSLSSKPGVGFLGSALIPGLSQAAGGQYWKTALYVAIEATSIFLIIDGNKRGRELEKRYINIGNQDWSVVKYASWVHDYYHNVPGARAPGSPDIDIRTLLTPAGLERYNQLGGFPSPVFDVELEWSWINLNALRQLEKNSLYLTSGRPFSHDVQDFGSQQYYELMSKYFQFGPGWRDWSDNSHNVNSGLAGMSPMWLSHARLEERFNDSFRLAGNMVTLLVVNHVVSAFDALFTIQLRNHRLESGMQVNQYGPQYQLTWRF
jgi:hypothetical protein